MRRGARHPRFPTLSLGCPEFRLSRAMHVYFGALVVFISRHVTPGSKMLLPLPRLIGGIYFCFVQGEGEKRKGIKSKKRCWCWNVRRVTCANLKDLA